MVYHTLRGIGAYPWKRPCIICSNRVGGREWGMVYYQKDGSKAADVFAKSGSNWFYLDSDGTMAKSQLIEKDDNYYYVNSAGAMVTNEWR